MQYQWSRTVFKSFDEFQLKSLNSLFPHMKLCIRTNPPSHVRIPSAREATGVDSILPPGGTDGMGSSQIDVEPYAGVIGEVPGDGMFSTRFPAFASRASRQSSLNRVHSSQNISTRQRSCESSFRIAHLNERQTKRRLTFCLRFLISFRAQVQIEICGSIFPKLRRGN
jgi:hypothetical protein